MDDHKKQLFLFTGLVVLVLIAASVAAYVVMEGLALQKNNVGPVMMQQQEVVTITADETAGWKTYRNEQFGFEVKYPAYLETTNPTSPEIVFEAKRLLADSFSVSVLDRPLDGYRFVTPGGVDTTYRKDTDAWVSVYAIDDGSGPQKYTTKEGIRTYVAGTGDSLGAAHIGFIETIGQDRIIELRVGISAGYVDCFTPCPALKPLNDSQTIYKILDTFRFFDETANWKTYRNEQYGFEVNYPNNWQIQTPPISETDPLKFMVTFFSSSNDPLNENLADAVISVFKSKDQPLDQYWETYIQTHPSVKKESIFIGNQSAVKITFESGRLWYLIEQRNRGVYYLFDLFDSSGTEYKILNSFKLLD